MSMTKNKKIKLSEHCKGAKLSLLILSVSKTHCINCIHLYVLLGYLKWAQCKSFDLFLNS